MQSVKNISADVPMYPRKFAEDPVPKTVLVNVEYVDKGDIDIYIGGKEGFFGFDASIHKNPFPVSEFGHEGAVENFKAFFFDRYLNDPGYDEKVHDLHGEVLGSWNYPKADHGQVIIDLLEAWEDGGGESGVVNYMVEELEELDVTQLGERGLQHMENAIETLEEDHGKTIEQG